MNMTDLVPLLKELPVWQESQRSKQAVAHDARTEVSQVTVGSQAKTIYSQISAQASLPCGSFLPLICLSQVL